MLIQIAPSAASAGIDVTPVGAGSPVTVRPARIADMLAVEPLINHFAAQIGRAHV